jgi:hypothetical protein
MRIFTRRHRETTHIELPELPPIDEALDALRTAERHRQEARKLRTHIETTNDAMLSDIVAAIVAKRGSA